MSYPLADSDQYIDQSILKLILPNDHVSTDSAEEVDDMKNNFSGSKGVSK